MSGTTSVTDKVPSTTITTTPTTTTNSYSNSYSNSYYPNSYSSACTSSMSSASSPEALEASTSLSLFSSSSSSGVFGSSSSSSSTTSSTSKHPDSIPWDDSGAFHKSSSFPKAMEALKRGDFVIITCTKPEYVFSRFFLKVHNCKGEDVSETVMKTIKERTITRFHTEDWDLLFKGGIEADLTSTKNSSKWTGYSIVGFYECTCNLRDLAIGLIPPNSDGVDSFYNK